MDSPARLSGQQFVEHLDRVLDIADEAERSKKLKQYQEWNANVHLMIQVLYARHHRLNDS